MTKDQILKGALQRLDPLDRTAFLAVACQQNDALRTEIEGLLQQPWP